MSDAVTLRTIGEEANVLIEETLREEADIVEEGVSCFGWELFLRERFAELQDVRDWEECEVLFFLSFISIIDIVVVVGGNVVEHRREFHPTVVERIVEVLK